LPGVQHAAIATELPLDYAAMISVRTEDQPHVLPGDENWVYYTTATSDFFKTVGARLIAGRTFSESEEKASAPVIVVNEAFAQKFFPGKNPIGNRVHVSLETELLAEVIGIISNMKQQLDAETDPQIYFSNHLDSSPGMALVARGNFLASNMTTLLTKQVREIDSQLPFFDAQPMTTVVDHASMNHRSIMFLFSFFSVVAACLAIVGIYSVISYSISRQTHEIGIRMSLGAQKQDVIRMILKKATWLIVAGTSIGLIFSFSLNRTLKHFIYGISRNDPATYFVVSLLVVTVAFIASALPAVRATKVDPIIALREE
jgi:putative ABC transport system permease protein